MRRTIITFAVMTTCWLFAVQVGHAGTSVFEKSARSSVSYVDLMVIEQGDNIASSDQQFLLDQIRKSVETPRFDFNPLPDKYVVAFKQEVRRGNLSEDQCRQALETHLMPHLIRVLKYYKEVRALPEVERHRFIVQKAKEDGVTAEDLTRVMNSAYIYIPSVQSYQLKRNGTISAELEIGASWYHLVFEGNTPVVRLEGRDLVSGEASASPTDTLHNKVRVTPEGHAFREAAEKAARNLKVRVAERFPTRAPIDGIHGRYVHVPLGKKEGIGKDTKFYVAEYYENDQGELIRHDVGHVLAVSIGDNRQFSDNETRCMGIIGSYETGMVAIEHPRLMVDLRVGGAWMPMTIDSFAVMIGSQEFVSIDGDYTTGTFGGQAALQYDLASAMNVSQLFFNMQLNLGLARPDGSFRDDDLPIITVVGLRGGFLKKFYLSRLALVLEANGTWQTVSMNNTVNDTKYEFQVQKFGGVVGGGLEFALGIDWNFGLGASYAFTEKHKYLELKIDGTAQPWFEQQEIDVDLEGLEAYAYLSYSLPSLPF
jgi:hypothetical protein